MQKLFLCASSPMHKISFKIDLTLIYHPTLEMQRFDAVLMPSLCQHIPTPQSVLVQVCYRLQHSPSPKELSSPLNTERVKC